MKKSDFDKLIEHAAPELQEVIKEIRNEMPNVVTKEDFMALVDKFMDRQDRWFLESNDSDEEVVYVSSRTSEEPGSGFPHEVTQCCICNEDVWLDSRRAMIANTLRIMCTECALVEVAKEEERGK